MEESKVYFASSWKNASLLRTYAELFRRHLIHLYCFCEEGDGQVHFNWPDILDVNKENGISCLGYEISEDAFRVDFNALQWANTCVLFNPCGRDAHLEAGFMKGKGGKLYIVGLWPNGEFSNMYHMADKLFDYKDIMELIGVIKNGVD